MQEEMEGKVLGKRMDMSLQCLCVCLHVPIGEELRRVIYFCSVDILPDPGQLSLSSSVLLAFSVKYGLSCVTASQGCVKLLRSP